MDSFKVSNGHPVAER